MLARERLMPEPGVAWRRSAYFGGAIRFSMRRGGAGLAFPPGLVPLERRRDPLIFPSRYAVLAAFDVLTI